MKKSLLLICFLCNIAGWCYARTVSLQYDTNSAQIMYAADILKHSLQNNSYSVQKNKSEYVIVLEIDPDKLGAEAYQLKRQSKKIIITGGDERGIIYGCQSLIEDIENGIILQKIAEKSESTDLHFRAIKFDLPWDTYRHSGSLYQHQDICADIEFWKAFLDMMCENRFNALTLWNLHPYTFLIKPQNFPEASPWTDEEMQAWKKLFKGIFKLAKERGIDTYIMPFNIFVTPEFSKAHGVALHNLGHHHFVEGDTSEIIKQYTKECVTQMLIEYPDLSGIGLTLGEGMGGMTPQQRENWIRDTIIEGMRLADRKSKLIHRIPFSGNKGSLGATNVEMEQITRNGIEREAAMECFEGPVWASLKFNWSHAHSTTKMIKVHGGQIYGTYWNPEPAGYKMVWTARNEDFFCLRWGVADFVREHIKTNTHNYVGGYFVGSETYIPAKDYFTKSEYSGDWKYAFERQWLFYKIWGRLLFNQDTPDVVFKNEFIRRYGESAKALFEAFSLAGKTPLRLASSFDCSWDFTLYSEGFLALDPEVRRVDYISIDRQINHPPLDTTFLSIKDYVNMLLADFKIPVHKTKPPELAEALISDCSKALE
ncbi:MAG: hypothetical protein JW956_05735, partial [Calditrichaceae bacterium]|nr:hypothetical protein [Calditrichaceae bacterium]